MTVPYTIFIGAPSGGDDTSTIQNAINTAVTAVDPNTGDGSCICRVKFGVGIYHIDGAVQQSTVSSGVTYNAQIKLPWLPSGSALGTDNQKIVLILEGAGPSAYYMWNQSGKQLGGTILLSSLTGLSHSGTYGPPSMIGGPSQSPGQTLTNLKVVFRGINVRVQDNPCLIGLDLGSVANCDVVDCVFDTDVIQSLQFLGGGVIAIPTNPCGIALRTTQGDGDDWCIVDRFNVTGWYAAIMMGDHCDLRNITIYSCLVGFAFWTICSVSSTTVVTKAACQWTMYGLAIVDPSSGLVGGTRAHAVFTRFVYEKDADGGDWDLIELWHDPSNAMHVDLGAWSWTKPPYSSLQAGMPTVNGGSHIIHDRQLV